MSASRLCFIATLVFAVATIIISGMMGTPPAPVEPMAVGFQTPILALEFAQRAEDLAFLQGEGAAPLREALMHTQALDRYFPLAYAGMAAVFFAGCWRQRRILSICGLSFAVLTIPADWIENDAIAPFLHNGGYTLCEDGVFVTAIANEGVEMECYPSGTAILAENGEVEAVFETQARRDLSRLQLTTWIKWGLIAAYALMMAGLMWQEKRRILAIPGAVAALALAATFLSGSNGHVAEIMGLTLLPFMLSFPIAAGMSLFKR